MMNPLAIPRRIEAWLRGPPLGLGTEGIVCLAAASGLSNILTGVGIARGQFSSVIYGVGATCFAASLLSRLARGRKRTVTRAPRRCPSCGAEIGGGT